MSGNGFTARKALLVLAGFWAVGVVLLVGASFGSVGVERLRDAPACPADQVFTPAYCRITVDATVTALTSDQITMDVGGRRVAPEVYLHGTLPDRVAGLPVRVTIYRGAAVHVQGGTLNFDTADAPADHVDELRAAGLFFLIGGAVLVGVNALVRTRRRADLR
ncbi:hypothetical protein GCM10010168_18970 [Actinoplanes ianthinogenes]|uniref:DUF3592 domain-containing protein n=1 Tax=Actinoplanes ianthinogenes TaxID=122358 RepID=A0ABN6CSC8_9ACTN|nr:hypothetical protein [Actinoplanes ianthinogenes]BCJ47539.1 hypothetical protein Aiant_81960 [Actinoplanes ianthinogenes]GGR02460.1 hypothetical protein GCM10010168_18970 [Actinoplanes ianthinogenes]